jgi:hypothetical protein
MDWLASQMNWLVPALLGFTGGIIGSLIVPWVQWAIEKRRGKFEYRQEMIKTWREGIDNFNWTDDDFGNSSIYGAIRPHIKPDMIEKFEAQRTFHVPPDGGRGTNLQKQWASDEVARIENEWGLL